MKNHMLAGLAAVLALAASVAHADATGDIFAAAHYEVVACRTHDAVQEKADNDLAATALKMLSTRDIVGAKALLPQLRAAQSRAPDAPAKPELCGNTLNIYSDSVTDLLLASSIITGHKELSAVLKGALPYGTIGFVIGWMEYEDHDFNAALADYTRARLNAPDDVSLASEYSSTLSALGRSQESYDAAASFIVSHPAISDHDHALLLRREGYALVDLNRLDDGAAAYTELLKYDPTSDVAKGELDYIKQHKASH